MNLSPSQIPNCALRLLSLAAAFSWSQTQAQETANVLPKGIWRARAVTVLSLPVNDSFNRDGARVEILHKLNASIPAQVQAEQSPELMSLYSKLNLVETGLGDKLLQTDLFAKGTLEFQRYTTALEYGVSDRFSLGVIVPVVHINLKADRKIEVSAQSQAIKEKLAQSGNGTYQALIDGLDTFESKAPTAVYFEEKLFTSKGYTFSNVSETGLGDIEVGGVWNYVKTSNFKSSFKSGFRLPTATHIAAFNNPFDKSSGDKQLDYAVQNIVDYSVLPNTLLASSLKYTWQLKNTQKQPVPSFGQVGLTNLIGDANMDTVTRDLGDIFDAELSLTQYFNERSFFAYSSYAYSFKDKDNYQGTKNLDFAALSLDSDSISHKYEVGLGYSTIPRFRAKKASIPLEVKVAFNGSLAGKNSPDAAYSRFDVIVYF